jgi:hypothetical protein
MRCQHTVSTTIKTGTAANSSANPATIKIQCSEFTQSCLKNTAKFEAQWSPGTFHGRNLATFCHHRTQIGPSCSVGMDVYTQKLIRLPNFVYYGI